MLKPTLKQVKPLEDYKLWLRFADGTTGNVDLSSLAGKGVFTLWNNNDGFFNVVIVEGRWLAWSNQVEIDADSLYLKLTGKHAEDLFPGLKEETSHA